MKASVAGRARRDQLTGGAIGLITGAALMAAVAFSLFRPSGPPAAVTVRAVIPTPASRTFSFLRPNIAISPDGRQVVYAVVESGVSRLYLRPVDQSESTLIRGTDGGEGPFFSPDGQHLGFAAAGQLKQVSLDGGAPVKICDAVDVRGAAWGPDGTIVFAPSTSSGLWRVPAAGGTPERFTALDEARNESTQRYPMFLPGGRTVLFVTATTDIASYADSQIVAQPLAGGPRKIVVQGGTSPFYAMGHLLYNRGDGLVAAPFDLDKLEVTGPPVIVAADVAWGMGFAVTHAAVASNGAIAYIPGG
jgi:serine/threonine-protein kinase